MLFPVLHEHHHLVIADACFDLHGGRTRSKRRKTLKVLNSEHDKRTVHLSHATKKSACNLYISNQEPLYTLIEENSSLAFPLGPSCDAPRGIQTKLVQLSRPRAAVLRLENETCTTRKNLYTLTASQQALVKNEEVSIYTPLCLLTADTLYTSIPKSLRCFLLTGTVRRPDPCDNGNILVDRPITSLAVPFSVGSC